MKKTYLLGGGIAVLTAAILVGCNGNDHDTVTSNTTQLTITPSLGKILNAKVIARNAVTGAQLGSGNTGSTGIAKFTAEKTTSPVVIEVQGTDGAQGATYFDESTNTNVPLPSTKMIRAIAPSLGDNPNFGVTVLTDLAYQAAIKAAGTEAKVNTADIVNQANNQIKALLAKELGTNSLLTPPTIIGKDTVIKDVITAKNAANDYALKLAGLAKLGTGTSPVLDALQKLSDDISDGKLDGNKGTTEIDYITGETADATVALQNYMTAYANAAQINGIYTPTILNGFQVVEGNITITVAAGGTGSGCVATISGVPVIGTYKVCYKNFPQDAVCGAGNTALSGISNIQVPGVSGNINWTFGAGSCEGALVTLDYAGTL